MKSWLPLAAAGWAVVTCMATFAGLAPPQGPAKAAPAAANELRESDRIAVAVPGPDGVHYLTFRLRYGADPQHDGAVPIEAAARDVIIGAATTTSGLADAEGWRSALETVLQGAKASLGVLDLSVVTPRRQQPAE